MITQAMKDLLVHYNKGLELYKQAKFQEAIVHFENALKLVPEDGPSKMYIERCKEYIKNPPPKDWDGVYVMKTK